MNTSVLEPVTQPKLLVPAATRLGPVRIAVTDAEQALKVWRDLVGLTVLGRSPDEIRLGAGGETLIVLEPGATRPVAPRSLGLYHVAIHVPARKDLARAVARLFQARFRNSPTDHLVTETTYLWDHDGNGIELTFETPERGRLMTDGSDYFGIDTAGNRHSGRDAVDLESLFGELTPADDLSLPLPAGTRIGHIHLHVADLDATMRFYAETIGFERLMLARRIGMGDVTVGYQPHIVAFNLWAGAGARQPPEGSAGLRRFSIEVPTGDALAAVRRRLEAAGAPVRIIEGAVETTDPAGNRLTITASG